MAQDSGNRERPPTAAGPPSDGASGRRGCSALRRLAAQRLFWSLVALAALLAFNALFTDGFFRIEMREGHLYGSVVDVLNRGAPVVLLALGMTLVIATGGIDLSVGSVMALSGIVAAALIARPAHSPLSAIDLGGAVGLAIGAALLAALVVGLLAGLMVSLLSLQPIVATLIMMVAVRGLAQVLSRSLSIPVASGAFEYLGSGFLLGVPVPIFIAALAVGGTYVLTRKTALGLFIESVGSNPTASRYAGIEARRVRLLVYGFSALCAGAAGLIVTADNQMVHPGRLGQMRELDAILAVCIGGTALTGGRFSLAGSTIGAVLIQTLEITILTLVLPRETTLVLKAVIVVTVCLLQSRRFRELLRRRAARRGGSP